MREGDFSLSTDESSSAHNRDVGQFPCPINAVYNLIRLHSRLGQTSDSLLRSFLKMFVLFCDRVDGNPGSTATSAGVRADGRWWQVQLCSGRAVGLFWLNSFCFNSRPWIVLALAGFSSLGDELTKRVCLGLSRPRSDWVGAHRDWIRRWPPASLSILFPSKLLLRL